MQGLGCQAQCLGSYQLGVWVLGFRVQGLGYRVDGLGCRVLGLDQRNCRINWAHPEGGYLVSGSSKQL